MVLWHPALSHRLTICCSGIRFAPFVLAYYVAAEDGATMNVHFGADSGAAVPPITDGLPVLAIIVNYEPAKILSSATLAKVALGSSGF